jgi:hypothetical protein
MQTLLPAKRPRISDLQPVVLDAARSAAGSARRTLARSPAMAGALRLPGPRRKRSFVSRHPVLLGAGLAAAAVGGVLAIPAVRSALTDASRRLTGRVKARLGGGSRRGDGAAELDPEVQVRQEELLDEAIEESFPASDPVSVKRIT